MSIRIAVLILACAFPGFVLAEDIWTQTLIDSSRNLNVGEFSITSEQLGIEAEHSISVSMKTLHGGKQEGVQVIMIKSGETTVTLLPTRGLSIHEVRSGDLRLGWDSPVKEHVHPQLIHLDSRGGLGWLEGFNEWMVRCGLEFAGHPGTDEFVTNTGEMGTMELTLHGKIGNIPASEVSVSIDKQAPHTIRIRGVVHECLFFGPKLRLTAELELTPGTSTLHLHDEVTNRGATDQEMQLIYHTNFGPPLLEEGAQVVVPVKQLVPMNDHAALAIDNWRSYRKPTVGFIEEVFLVTPHANEDGETGVVLHNQAKDRACSLHWNISQLPYLTVWKNTVAEADGYVTGLEPATGFPFHRKIERSAGRVVVLKAGETRPFDLTFKFHRGEEVHSVIEAIQLISDGRPSEIRDRPFE